MRFDLTNAAFRTLDRAGKLVLPVASSEISPAKLLIALFEEEECRAADWLDQAGLNLEKFRVDFGWDVSTLQTPISAPNFPVGDYGVPPGLYQGTPQIGTPRVEASPPDGNAPPVGYPEHEPLPEDEIPRHPEKLRPPPQEPDDWTASESPPTPPPFHGYSLYPPFQTEIAKKSGQNRLRFYLDDQPVHVGRISADLEDSLEIILHRFARQMATPKTVPGAGGGVFYPAFSLATEHLLLAVVLDEGDAGRWLRDHGFEASELYHRIETLGVDGKTTAVRIDEPIDIPDENTPRTVTNVSEQKVFRLLDAAINRAREAVRVIEDYVRFVLDDEPLTRRIKDFRHRFQEVSRKFPDEYRLGARDTDTDVGTEIEGIGEYRRSSAHDVLAANFARLQESLRSLEEFSKLVAPELSRRFEQLRYRCYSLHKIVSLAEPVTEKEREDDFTAGTPLNEIRLYALVDCRSDETTFVEHVAKIISGGVDVIQLRDKNADDRNLLDRAGRLKRIIAESDRPVLFVMNDRPDLAVLAGADGVHVGQEELTVEQVRRIVGPKMLIGVSTHDIEQAHRAVADGADYLGAGPVFESSTKSFENFPGTDFLKQVAAEIKIPAFAIGGITLENLDEVLATGVNRVAVGSALLDAEDPRSAAEAFFVRLHADPS